jgi:hypothetical protein
VIPLILIGTTNIFYQWPSHITLPMGTTHTSYPTLYTYRLEGKTSI